MAQNNPDDKVVEQLFLDIPINHALRRLPGLVEAWVSKYVGAIRDRRFGDAIWARYHTFGNTGGEEIDSDDAVLEEIKEDALGYRVADTEEYFKALSFYATTSASDRHRDVLEMLANLDQGEIADTRAQIEAEREEE